MQNMNMKKILMGTMVTSGILLASCTNDPEVASTEAGRIRQEEFYERLKEEPNQQGGTLGEQVLQQMLIEDILENAYGDEVTDEMVDQEMETLAAEMGGQEQFDMMLEQQGLSEEDARDMIRPNLYIREAVRERVEISEEELQEAYDSTPAEGTRVAHILVEDPELAEELIAELNDGADFTELAHEHSIDEASLETDGEMDLNPGEMVPEFEEAAMQLEEGEISEQPVQTQFGFHIIEMREAGEVEQSFEEMRDELEDQVLDQYLATDQMLINEIMYELVQDANVQISDEDLQGAMEQFMTPPEEQPDPMDELPIDEEELEETPADTPEEEEQEEEVEETEEEEE